MTISGDCPQGRSQDFTFLWRGLLQGLAPKVLPFLLPRTQPQYGLTPFAIGDKVADHWIDEFEIEQIEYGEVMGVCWHPREQAWAYLVDWTHGTMPPYAYPCFDGHLLIGGDLRLVNHA